MGFLKVLRLRHLAILWVSRASVMVAIGVVGLARFGITDPPAALTHKNQDKVSVEFPNTTDNISVP